MKKTIGFCLALFGVFFTGSKALAENAQPNSFVIQCESFYISPISGGVQNIPGPTLENSFVPGPDSISNSKNDIAQDSLITLYATVTGDSIAYLELKIHPEEGSEGVAQEFTTSGLISKTTPIVMFLQSLKGIIPNSNRTPFQGFFVSCMLRD